jgi:hypothetical protein
MSQRSKTIHEFKAINLSQSTLDITNVNGSLLLNNSHSGDFISLNSTSGCTITLPSPTPGLNFNFVINNTGAHTLTASSAIINGSISHSVFSTSANLATGTAKSIIATTTGSAVGDTFTLTGNGSKYFLKGCVSNHNAVEFA